MQSNVNRANDSRYSRSHYFIWSVTNFWLLRDLKNLLTGTTSSHQCSQQLKTLSLDITKPYNLLLSENTSKFYIWKTKKVTSKKVSDKITVNRQSYHLTEIFFSQFDSGLVAVLLSHVTCMYREEKGRNYLVFAVQKELMNKWKLESLFAYVSPWRRFLQSTCTVLPASGAN